jgi:RimJ/RimL family protein N-acetyltransferase
MLKGKLVRLAAVEPKELAEAIVLWNRDSEFQRLGMIEPANQYSVKKLTGWAEKGQDEVPPKSYEFAIRTLENDRLVGTCGLGGELFPHGEGFVGIGIGERDQWGKGYGTDAMRVILRYAFQELNLRRVVLSVSLYNPRAIHSYEKAGFIHEGRMRGFFLRESQRWDIVFMGILRDEWLAISQRAS